MSFVFVQDDLEVTDVAARAEGIYRRWGKRTVDIFLTLAIVPFGLPIGLLAWGLMKLDGSAGLFSQTRVGRNGRNFRCWKIRTMVPDAESVLAKLVASDEAVRLEWQSTQKLAQDPRVTTLGGILRKLSIDELPQLWNVLVGDMSMIGPRPFMPHQKAIYDRGSSNPSYYGLRPGISGLWQVKSRNQGSFMDRFYFDEQYSGTLSLVGDLKIGLETLKVILRATGR